MKPVTREWVAKAEADFQSAVRELRRRNNPNLDIVCFLSQQCIEKYIKARLQEESIVFSKSHDLVKLVDQLEARDPALLLLQPALKPVSAYAVVFRYPGRDATRPEAKEEIALAKQVREIVRGALRLPKALQTRARKLSQTQSRISPKKKGRLK